MYKATQFRDGLMIALLICCPMRLRNLTEIVIDRHLNSTGQAYRLEFTAAETKTGRPYHAAVPHELTSYVDDYLHLHRPSLQLIGTADGGSIGGRLWLGWLGKPLSSRGVERQIMLRTQEAFGRSSSVLWHDDSTEPMADWEMLED